MVDFKENEKDEMNKETSSLLYRYQNRMIKDTWNPIYLPTEHQFNMSKLFPNQLIQISHFEPAKESAADNK